MIPWVATSGGSSLDDFLAGAGDSVALGVRLQRIGLIGSTVGVLVAAGLLVFLAAVHRGSDREIAVLLRMAGGAGAIALVGAAVEVAGAANLLDVGWFAALGESSAPMLRLIAGTLIALGLFADTVPAEDAGVAERDEIAGPLAGSGDTGSPVVRWVPGPASSFGSVGAVVGLLSFGFDGHTVSKGRRLVHALVDLVHVGAAAVWFGGIVGLAVVAFVRRRTGPPTSPLVVRFSSIATVALLAVTAAGVAMAMMIADGWGDLTGTAWGRTLLVKLVAVAVAAAIGGYNHFVVVPAMRRDGDADAAVGRARLTVTCEAFVLLIVAVVTVFLTTSSTT